MCGAGGCCVLRIASEASPKILATHPMGVVGSGSNCRFCTPLPGPFSWSGGLLVLVFGAAFAFVLGVLPVGGWPERVLCCGP